MRAAERHLRAWRNGSALFCVNRTYLHHDRHVVVGLGPGGTASRRIDGKPLIEFSVTL